MLEISTTGQLFLENTYMNLIINKDQLIAALVNNYLDGYQRGYEEGFRTKNSKVQRSGKESETLDPPRKDSIKNSWEQDFPDVTLARQEKLSFYALNEVEYTQNFDRSSLNQQECRCYEMAIAYWRLTKERAIKEGCPWPPIFEFIVNDIDF